MKQILTFHYTYYLIALSYILAGYYQELIAITTLIIVHEFGHYITAKILNFKVEKITIYPFGGITKITDLINKDINKEILIASAGVIFQFLFYVSLVFLNKHNVIRDYTIDIYTLYNSQIIFFNLLPIYPLDGAKIINLLLSKIFNYNLSNKLTVIISLSSIVIMLTVNTYNHNYSYFMIISIILNYNYKYFTKLKYLYNKFLLERYLYNIKYPDIKVINNIGKMYKNKTHIIRDNQQYFSEKRYLSKYYSSNEKC